MKLLIVEHSQTQLARLRALLGDMDGLVTLLTARSLEQAFKTIALEMPALAIVDLHMPGGNPLRGVRRMKSLCAGMLVAGLTFEPSSFDRTWCLDAGVDFVLDKASESAGLSAIVQRAAQGQAFHGV